MTTKCVELWAKDDGETLLAHTLNVIEVSQQICTRLPFPMETRKELAILLAEVCAFHDLGKATVGFQIALRLKAPWQHRHEILSTALAHLINPDLIDTQLLAILTHHRSLPESLTTEDEKCLPDDEFPPCLGGDEDVWHQIMEDLKANWVALIDCMKDICERVNLPLKVPDGWIDLGSLGLAEAWIRRPFQNRRINPEKRKQAALIRGLLMSSDHIASAGIDKVPEVPKLVNSPVKEQEIGKDELRPFQKKCAEIEGDVILKAPTGSGKTGAALLWAAKNQSDNGRLFYVLPYTASINAMHQRLQRVFPPNDVGILHHRNAAYLFRMLEDDLPQSKAKSARLQSSLAREIYHPIRVCTPHQIIRVALQGKGWELGFAEFQNACFIFDEVHAFDPLLAGLTIAAAKWLQTMGAKVLFASATLPSFLESLLSAELNIPESHIVSPNAELPGDQAICEKIRHCVSIQPGTLLQSIEDIAREINRIPRKALIICNHVATSQTVWEVLNKEYHISSKLLHARFNSRDRAEIEKAITGKDPPRVLVSTQAIEVSLDLDYDLGFSESAPIDALGQRFGRINRKGLHQNPAPMVIFEQTLGDFPIYNDDLTRRTTDLLSKVNYLTEGQLIEIVNEVYRNGYQDKAKEDFKKGRTHPIINNFDEQIVTGTHHPWVLDVIQASDGQIEVLPHNLTIEYAKLKDQKRYLEAAQLLVPIRIGQKFHAEKRGSLQYSNKLREWVIFLDYSSEKGLDLKQAVDKII